MSMTVVVTRNAPERYRGFLASCLLEIAPGVYASPSVTDGVRQRIWSVCEEWASVLPGDGGVLMAWPDRTAPSGLGLKLLGFPKATLVELDGIWLACREGTAEPAADN
jgi:CRISPR-associated protein Cas2